MGHSPTDTAVEMPDELTTPANPPMVRERYFEVNVNLVYRILAVDNSDAMQQVSRDLGEGRSFRWNDSAAMAMNCREVNP